jgi:hypothetical protein
MNDYVVVGDPLTVAHLKVALSRQGQAVLDIGELELQDEWDCRRWFARNSVAGVFVCLGLSGPTSVANFMGAVLAPLNVFRAAIGNAGRIVLVSSFPSAEYFLFKRLLDLYWVEKQVDAYAMSPAHKEGLTTFSNRCVLSMLNVSAKETHQNRAQRPQPGGQVRDQVVSQRAGVEDNALHLEDREGHRISGQPEAVLEVPVAAAQGQAPGDVCPQRHSQPGAAAESSIHDNPGAVQGMVRDNRLS